MTLVRDALALATCIAFTAACASSAAPATSAPAAGGGGASATIDISGFAFATTALEVTKGATVTWSNKDNTTHTVSSGTPPTKDGKFDGQVPAGGTFKVTFTDAGTFRYFCSIHNSMTGTITVK
jgi:plastocyanin